MDPTTWDHYDNAEVYDDDHIIEEDLLIQQELESVLNPQAPEFIPTHHEHTQTVASPPSHDFNQAKQRLLTQYFKGGGTHVAHVTQTIFKTW